MLDEKIKNAIKEPVELNATIYNNLVKVFNDASNGIIGGMQYKIPPEFRNKVIEARKRFPTYQELKDSGIKFVNFPMFIDSETKEKIDVKSWVGDGSGVEYSDANILQATIVYTIGYVVFNDPKTFQPIPVLKMRGIPTDELREKFEK